MYYAWVIVLIVGMCGAWLSTLFTIPGNWLIAGLAAAFAFFFPAAEGHGISWITVGVAFALALVGEVIELAAGAAGAKRAGASRRAMVLAIGATMVGSVLGAFAGVPIPVVGPLIGALGGGAGGAFVGAFLGESAIGRDLSQSTAAGKGALIGRLLGTVGKLVVGVVMIAIIVADALF
jgi:hypothetical protein